MEPGDPSPNSNDWESRRYQEESYGSLAVIDFSTATEAQHVAVYSNNMGSALALAEVVVYGKFSKLFYNCKYI